MLIGWWLQRGHEWQSLLLQTGDWGELLGASTGDAGPAWARCGAPGGDVCAQVEYYKEVVEYVTSMQHIEKQMEQRTLDELKDPRLRPQVPAEPLP